MFAQLSDMMMKSFDKEEYKPGKQP